MLEFAFEELSLREVFATVDDDYSASIRVLEKAGMKFERFEFDEDGRFSVYSIKKLATNNTNDTNYFLLFLFVSFVLFVLFVVKTSS